MVSLKDTPLLDLADTVSFVLDDSLPLTAKVASILLCGGRIYKKSNLWQRRCLYTLISSQTRDPKLPQIFFEIICHYWSTFNWLELFQNFVSAGLDVDMQKHIIHLIQTYNLKPTLVKSAVDGPQANIIMTLNNNIENEESKVLAELLHEIRDSSLMDESFLGKVESISRAVYSLLENFNISLDYKSRLRSSKA